MPWKYKPVELKEVTAPPKGARTLEQAAEAWGVSKAQVRKWLQQKKVEAVLFRAGGLRLTYVLTKERPSSAPPGRPRKATDDGGEWGQ